MEKLELKQLAPYLPYGLKCVICFPYEDVETAIQYNQLANLIGANSYAGLFDNQFDDQCMDGFKPILRPLSDLTKEIEVDGKKFIPIERMIIQFSSEYKYCDNGMIKTFQSLDDTILLFINNKIAPECHYGIARVLFKWHFDVFGLIEKGLAIDINTI